MSSRSVLVALVLLGAVAAWTLASGTKSFPSPKLTAFQAKVYVCPKCGAKCDDKTFDAPGKCPDCGMVLIERSAGPTERLAVGKVGPNFQAVDQFGKPFRLSDYKGKVIVLDFWEHW